MELTPYNFIEFSTVLFPDFYVNFISVIYNAAITEQT